MGERPGGGAPPSVSVVVPTRNRAGRLERLLGALREQTAGSEAFEVIVVDDGSTDATSDIIERANNTPYGLSAGVWTEKGSRILSMAQRLRAGVIWANTYNRFDPASPFGGYKESGFGREGGLHGLGPYLDFE